MDPDIVREEPSFGGHQMPDVHSDHFSLTVILFLALCLGNSFEGECLKKYDIVDEDSEYEMFGKNPVFIYNKEDKSNRPIRRYHSIVIKTWPRVPVYIKEAFHRTFTKGLVDRENERTTEIEWLKLLTKYRDELITCSCGKQYIYGFEEKIVNDKYPYCWRNTADFCELLINRNRIILESGKKLFMNHIDKYSDDYSKIVGVVVRNKKNPSLWGVKLSLDKDIEIKNSNGSQKNISKDGVITIVNNLEIKFSDNSLGQNKFTKKETKHE